MVITDPEHFEKLMDDQLDRVVQLTKQNDELNEKLTELADANYFVLACITEYHTHEGTITDYELVKKHLPELEERLRTIVNNGFKSGKTYDEISTEITKATGKLIEILKRRDDTDEED